VDTSGYLSTFSLEDLVQLYEELDKAMIDALSDDGVRTTGQKFDIKAVIDALSDPARDAPGEREQQAKAAVRAELQRRSKSEEGREFCIQKADETLRRGLAEGAEELADAETLGRKPKDHSGALKYRSGIRRAIALELTRNPHASDLEICRGLDADGGIELPNSWKRKPDDRLFTEAYNDSGRRNKIESGISKVRAGMREKGLL
jgi:hypothetical protein